MIRRSVFTLILSLGIALVAAAETPERVIDLALGEIGTGSATEIRERIIVKGYTFIEPQFRQQAIADLPDQVRHQRITSGSTLRRVEKALKPILELYDREGTVEVVLYRSDLPQAMLYRGCVLVLSNSLAGSLIGAELTGIISHEVAHTYFMKEMVETREAKDKHAMKIVELKCDAIAVLSLRLLGFDSGHYISGLRKREKVANEQGLSSKFALTHPDVQERAQFIGRFQKLLVNVR